MLEHVYGNWLTRLKCLKMCFRLIQRCELHVDFLSYTMMIDHISQYFICLRYLPKALLCHKTTFARSRGH
jgi:hypothetical protein